MRAKLKTLKDMLKYGVYRMLTIYPPLRAIRVLSQKISHICTFLLMSYMKVSNDNSQIEFWNEFIMDGNLDALSKIYLHYYDLLFDFGRRHSNDKQLVEDTIQDIFVNFIKVRESIGIVKNLNGYLFCIFRRQLFHDINKQHFIFPTEQISEECFDYFKSPEQEISEKENIERIHLTIKQCIGKLTAKQQEIMFLRFEREISYEDIAESLNISVDSCYKAVHRAIKMVRSEAEKIVGKGGNLILWIFFRSTR
jgi:RNA polymerase sigma factor (sigma-70 family)